MAVFDAYVMVDWSGAAKPKRGKDSIWVTIAERGTAGLTEKILANVPTRHGATRLIASRLAELSARGLSVLLGFDFAFAYPAGFAKALDPLKPDWMGVWWRLSRLIEDEDDNANNRFEVAARLNGVLTGAAAPFWGCPTGRARATLTSKAPTIPHSFSVRRLAEKRAPSTRPAWQLYGNGSVGSQTLLGIPRLLALRRSRELAAKLRIWPFETGLRHLERGAAGRIILGEIWPGIVREPDTGHEIRDARQVRAWAEEYARLDAADLLSGLFAGDPALSEAEREIVQREEGWILGVTGAARNSLAASRSGGAAR